MPAYFWLDRPLNEPHVQTKMRALRKVGVPYTDAEIAGAFDAIKDKTELEALIAYLQGLGTALKQAR